MTDQRLLTPDELAERWQISKGLIYKMCQGGRLKPVKIGKYLRFAPDEIERLESNGQGRDDDR